MSVQSPDRLSLALPVDVIRRIDVTVSESQIDANQVLSSGQDYDAFASAIEDAEGEFKRMVGLSSRVSREGIPGKRETFEQPTYKTSGHALTKATFTGVWSDYLPEQQNIPLKNVRVLPFDSAEDDAVYFYMGLDADGSDWIDITDEKGDAWDIVDHRSGLFTFDPYTLIDDVIDYNAGSLRSMPNFLKRFRFAISYRHGILDRDSSQVGQTALSNTVTAGQTGGVAVDDVDVLSRGRVSSTAVLRIGPEYVTAEYDRANGEVDIIERGVRGTEAVEHDAGTTIMYVPPEYRKAVASRAGMEVATSSRYTGWLPDADDSMDRSEVIAELEATWSGIVDALGGE
jgi:hypothetical protein